MEELNSHFYSLFESCITQDRQSIMFAFAENTHLTPLPSTQSSLPTKKGKFFGFCVIKPKHFYIDKLINVNYLFPLSLFFLQCHLFFTHMDTNTMGLNNGLAWVKIN